MAATVTALGTSLLTAYGIANDLGKNEANPLTNAVNTTKLRVQLNAIGTQLQVLKKELAECDMKALKERAEKLKEEIQMYASEQEPTTGPQTGGGQTGGVTRSQAKAALGELTEKEVAGLQNAITDYMVKVDTSSNINQAEAKLYKKQLTTLAEYAQKAMTRNFRDTASSYIDALDERLTKSPGSDDKDVTIAWDNVQRRQNIDQLERGEPAPPSPAVSTSTAATEPSPPSPPPPAPPAPAPAPPEPPASTSTETDGSIVGALTSAATGALGAITGPKTPIKGLDKLLAKIDNQVLKDLTLENVKGRAETLREVEKAFRELREARKRNEPFDDRILKEKVEQLLTSVEEYWPDFSAKLAVLTPELVKQYFDLLYAVRALKGEIGEEETSDLTERYNTLTSEFLEIQTSVGSAVPPAPAPPPPEPPIPGAGTGLLPAPMASDLSTPTGSETPTPPETPTPTPSETPTPTPSETPAPAPREIPSSRTADALERDNEQTLINDLRASVDVEDLEKRVADYRELLKDPRFDGEEGTAANARLTAAAEAARKILLEPAPAPAPTNWSEVSRTLFANAPKPAALRGSRKTPALTRSLQQVPLIPSRPRSRASSTESVPVQATEGGQEIMLQNPLPNLTGSKIGEAIAAAPGTRGVAARTGLADLAAKFGGPVAGRTVGTVKKRNIAPEPPEGGRRRTLRKKRLTPRRGKKTNGK